MADDIQLSSNVGVGAKLRTEQLTGTLQHVQHVKIVDVSGGVESALTLPVSLSQENIPVAASGQVAGVGNNTLLTPAAGKKLRLFYCSYNPLLAVEAAFRFGAAGTLWLRNDVAAKAVIAKDFGAAMRYVDGGVDQPLILNLSLGVNVNWNVFYSEV